MTQRESSPATDTITDALQSRDTKDQVARVQSNDDGPREITKIARRRRQHGYEALADNDRPRESLPEED